MKNLLTSDNAIMYYHLHGAIALSVAISFQLMITGIINIFVNSDYS
jgi:hypothetical protein